MNENLMRREGGLNTIPAEQILYLARDRLSLLEEAETYENLIGAYKNSKTITQRSSSIARHLTKMVEQICDTETRIG